MSLNDCYNFEDFRKLAKKNLPAQSFIILMEALMTKQHSKETQNHF